MSESEKPKTARKMPMRKIRAIYWDSQKRIEIGGGQYYSESRQCAVVEDDKRSRQMLEKRGEKWVMSIRETSPGKNHGFYYDIIYNDGSMVRVFNVEEVHYHNKAVYI